ncbi:glycoside hydrolase superfamily [Truncatella angustata]|uniref:chitinase n=1 Tax=Truncatella angustata TaxID=152316 RepID=A0A9P8ZW43_9PEZI|nr:glycoside hydrolase superfamily [Truncatella angustata]KAH6651588.1 glycoside hydrolase superfamily [Truncatella angustata]
MCGQYSEDADMPCGMKLCCSATGWCGTTDVYCANADPLHGTLPCQSGYGSCAITGPPSCASGSGSSSKRKIGYYQSWNQRDRKCNKVAPNQLNTEGYTHLFFSFASMDPTTYRIAPAHPDDVQGMKDFTALSKDGKLQTWIAVGGFDFSNPEAASHTTWSDMVSTKANRAAFISSAKEYMDTYGFQGIDLDWEYPGAPERGGKKLADTRNFSLLVKEMRAAYGTSYGISVTLAPDYWYLRWFDAKAMEPNVDFFGFMAYDLHGSWDADVKTLGSLVRGQADIREISKNTLPLWFDGLDPAKLNFGLAMYGRGYTLADPTCNQLLCPFSGPSNPAPCTSFGGVMSLVEIKQLIKQRGIEPKYLEESMMKQITWDDQWMGYDDEDTFAAKMAYADSLCFGGTMVWSIDFQEVGSGG